MQPKSASALSPPLLQPKPVAASAEVLLKECASLRRASMAYYNQLIFYTWSEATFVDAQGAIVSQNVEPSMRTIVFHADGSEQQTTVAGQPFPGQEHAGLREPGTVLLDEHLAPEETLSGILAEPIPSEASQLATWIEETLDINPKDANAVTREITGVLASANVTPGGQEAAVLEYLSQLPAVSLLGEVQDRNGRDGVAFATESDLNSDYHVLIVNPDSGQTLGTETIHAPANGSDPTVTYYASWVRN